MKKLLLLSACLWALTSLPVLAQTAVPAVAIVTSYVSGLGNGHFLVNKNGQMEIIDYTANGLEKAQKTRSEALRLLVAKLYQEGYSLKAAGSDTELIFIKDK